MTSCNEIASALGNLQFAVAGIQGLIDGKIAPLQAEIEALKAQLGKVPNDGVKKSELESLVNPLIGAAVGGFATKTQLQNMGVNFATKGELSTVNGKASSALGQSTSAITKAEQAASTASNLSFEIRKVENVANNASDLAKRIDPEDVKRALAQAQAAGQRVNVAIEIATEAKGAASNASGKAGSAASAADDAKRLAGKASAEAAEAGGKAARAVGEAAEATTKAAKALSWADEALKGVGRAFSQLAKFAPLLALLGVVSTLLDVALNTGSLLVLGNRIDQIEKEIDRLSADMSKILGLMTAIKNELKAEIKAVYDYAVQRGNAILEELYNRTRGLNKAELDKIASELAAFQASVNNRFGEVNNKIADILNRISKGANPVDLSAINAAISALTAKDNSLQAQIGNLQLELSRVPALIDQKVRESLQGLTSALTNISKEFDAKLSAFKQDINKNLIDLGNKIAAINATLATHGSELARLASLIAGGVGITALATYTYGALTSRVASVTSTVNTNLTPRVQRLETQVKTIDLETKNMPCRYSPALDQQNLATSNRNQQIMLGMEAFNTVQMATVQNKLGSQLPGGLSGAATRTIQAVNAVTRTISSSFDKTWKFLKLDRVLNVLTFAASLHNALMLSRSLGETLLDVTSSVLSAIGLKDANGLPFDLQEFFGKQFEEFVKGIVGAEAYEGNKEKWNKANRIISSAANLLWSMQSMLANVTEGLEIIGGWVARMANGMKFDGLVSDNLYGWFNPNPDFKNPVFKAMERLNNLDDAASQIYMISTNAVDFQDTAQQLDTQKKELRKAIDDYNTAQTTAEITQNAANESPEITAADKAPAPEQG